MVIAPGTGRGFAPGLGLCHLAGVPPPGFRQLPHRQEISPLADTCICRPGCSRPNSSRSSSSRKQTRAAAASAGHPVDVRRCEPRPGHRRTAQGRQVLLGQELARGQSRGGQDHRHAQDRPASKPKSPKTEDVPREKFTPRCKPRRRPRRTSRGAPRKRRRKQTQASRHPRRPDDGQAGPDAPRRTTGEATSPNLPARAPSKKRWRASRTAVCPGRR